MEQPKHIDMQTPNGAQLNLDALYLIVPSCFTEAMGEDGEVHRVVDFNKLRLLLGDQAVEDAPEVYDFTWVGKRAALREAAAPINKTLRPCPEESVDWDSTQNLYIEGDNLEVLKLLQNSYMGKVKMIYIDPPYNTGNDFVYHDDFFDEDYDKHNLNEEGERLYSRIQLDISDKFKKNTDSNGRFHSDWCSMMYARLMVARSLLTEDGVIFISIDDCEIDSLRKIANETFGEANFVAQCVRKRRDSQANLSKNISPIHEYVVIYAKQYGDVLNKVSANIDESSYRNPDNDPRGPYVTMPCTNRGGAVYTVKTPTGQSITEEWRFKKETYDSLYNDNRIVFPRGGDGKPRYKLFLSEKKEEGALANTWLDYTASNQEATREIKSFFGDLVFDTPKPTGLLKFCIELGGNKDALILDFFAGSCTTAHAVMLKNSEDGGNRKFIMVQLPEETSSDSEAYKAGYKNICEIGKERIRRAGKKIKEEHPEAKDLDIGFRVFKCESSNYKDVAFAPKEYTQDMLAGLLDNIKEDRTDLDLLFDCMLRWGVELSLPLSSQKVDGCTLHNVNDGDLVACFDGHVTEAVIDAIAALSPVRVVFRDSSFNEAAQKMNLFELFKQKCDWTDEEVKNNVRVI